jgi:predicted regulator of Ras-like GTPase activity (Roadblock/LC7/MglB family)
VRADQLREPAVPHVETPILTATMQDSKRFGTKIEPIEASTLPPVPVEPATAHTIAAAQPEAIVQEKTAEKTTSSGQRVISLHSPELRPKSEPLPLKSIPFDLSPNGTGALASERVPASSGPPVPTTLPFSPEVTKIATPSEPSKPSTSEAPKIFAPELQLPKQILPAPGEDGRKIALGLKTVLQNLPVFQLTGAIGSVGEDERIEFPLSLIESQLASGRISISAEAFQAALPEKHRNAFQIDAARTPVLLPLEEVLKNLPATVLKLRDDQEQFNLDKDFETPFLIKAREDAQRLISEPKKQTETPSKPAEGTAPESKVEIKTAEPAKPEEKIDPKEFVAQACALPGVKACAITFADGLSLAGNLPDELAAEGLCAMAPPFLSRIDQHMRASKLGPLASMTLHSSDMAISFFARENICLTVLHAAGEFAHETQVELAVLTSRLSRIYTKSE